MVKGRFMDNQNKRYSMEEAYNILGIENPNTNKRVFDENGNYFFSSDFQSEEPNVISSANLICLSAKK